MNQLKNCIFPEPDIFTNLLKKTMGLIKICKGQEGVLEVRTAKTTRAKLRDDNKSYLNFKKYISK